MDKRKEMKEAFNPENVKFVEVLAMLDWSKEVSPVDLVKAVNKVEGLKGRKKYETNEKSFSQLIKCFEKKVGDLVTTRIAGKDRFYTLKPEYKLAQLVEYARTGKILEIKEELKKRDPKFYRPNPLDLAEMYEEEKKAKEKKITKKRIFPDCEAMAKSAILLSLLRKGKGKVEARIFNGIRDKFGWKYQRSVDSKPYTAYLEVNRFCADYLDLGKDLIRMDKKDNHYKCDREILEDKIKDTLSLMEDEDLKKKVLEIIEEEDVKEEEKPKSESVKKTDKEKIDEEEKVEEKPKPKPKTDDDMPKPKRFESATRPTEPRPRIFKASPEVGKSEFKETGSASPILYEGSKTKWYKSLIAGTLKGAERGVWFSYSDISQSIKKTRFVEISAREIKDLCGEIGKQWRGIFREVDFGGVTTGSTSMINELVKAYPAEKITETIFVRLKMSLEEIQLSYPELNVKLASEISVNDNIYEIEVNRAEKTEKAFARLVFGMRQGEIILESPANWTVKRAKILVDRLQNFNK